MLPKIVTKEQKEKREKRMRVFFAVFMAVVLGASTIGFALSSSSSQTEKYNGIRFSLTDQGWVGKNLGFATVYLPREVEEISFEGMLSPGTFNQKIYIVTDPAMSFASELYELSRAIAIKNYNPACLPEDADKEGCEELALIDCDNADLDNTVIIFKVSNETFVRASGSCLEVYGEGQDLIRAVDRVIYGLYGVIN